MHATVPLGDFRSALSRAERVTGRHASLPILEGVYIELKEGSCTLRATNLSVGFEESIPAKISVEGSVVVHPEKVLAAISGGSEDGSIELRLEGEHLTVLLPSGQFLVRALPSGDFPSLPLVSEGESLTCPAKDFLSGISRVLFAASISEVKPELASVMVRGEDHTVYFVATDAFRLAEATFKTPGVVAFPSIMIPARSAGLFQKLIPDTGDVTLTVSDTQVSIVGKRNHVSLRLTPGTFPDYRRIIPQVSTTTATILRADLVLALRSLAAFTDRDFRIDVSVNPETKTCILTSSTHDTGSGEYRLDALLEGPACEVRINQKSLSDALAVLNADTVVLRMTEPNRPIVVVGQGDTSFLYLMMPMHR